MEKGFNILIIPLHSDNFCYYIYSNSSPLEGVLIDVGDASVVDFCKLHGFTPKAILSTHKHWDHTNGNSAMKNHFKDLLIYGGELDNVPECTNKVRDGDKIEIGDMVFNCYHVPCHTKGHILYHIDTGSELEYTKTKEEFGVLVSNLDNALFTGDTLFIGGCGRFFEGNPKQMVNAFDKILSLNDQTKIFCGHEYALQNYEYTMKFDSENDNLLQAINQTKTLLENNLHSVPSTIHQEKLTNPFMQCNTPRMQTLLNTTDPVECMRILRSSKDEGLSPIKL